MRAQLARHARRVLLQHARSPSCAVYSAPLRRRHLPRPIASAGCSYRSFFDGLFQKAPREVRDPEFEPGWMKIMVWRSRMLDHLRPPPTEELVQAWRAFFEGKLSSRNPLNETQAMQCRRLFDYLLNHAEPSAPNQPNLAYQDVLKAFTALEVLRPREMTQQHIDLTKNLYSALDSGSVGKMLAPPAKLWSRYVKTLCKYGGSKEALDLLYKNWDEVEKLAQNGTNLVIPVAEGLANHGDEEDMLKLVHHAEKNGIAFTATLQTTLVTFFAERNRIPETKKWFQEPTSSGRRSPKIYPLIAGFAARNDLKEWAVPFFLELGESKPRKDWWDSLLQAILVIGNGLKQVEAMMSHMEDSSKGPVVADTATINGLLRAADDIKAPTLAEDILSLAADKDIKLDGESHLVLMKMRLKAGYLPGVHTAYKKVTHVEPWHTNPNLWWEYGELLNSYLTALCSQTTPDFKLISEVIELAEENQVHIESGTVAALCIQLLGNEQQFDVMDILSVHAFQFSAAEREVIQDAFVTFCLTESSTSRAWSGYQLLRQFFQDLSFERRVKLMEGFFGRKRPDMAAHVFGHMRQHRNSDYHPKRETYIACFEGFGQNPDPESLEIVYNMLKMDTAVEPNTTLYTSLILAHAACDKPLQALDFWSQITSSREGPSYASLEAIFWALERNPRGLVTAQGIWRRMQKMDIEVPPRVYNAYLGAVAASGDEKSVQDAVLQMAAATGSEPDAMTLGVVYNALPGQKLQSSFKSWAGLRYLDAWAELEKKGKRMNENSLCQFKLNRVLKA
ncbi:hypothetical protein ACJ41O_005289 [Fusarium nematophilum]